MAKLIFSDEEARKFLIEYKGLGNEKDFVEIVADFFSNEGPNRWSLLHESDEAFMHLMLETSKGIEMNRMNLFNPRNLYKGPKAFEDVITVDGDKWTFNYRTDKVTIRILKDSEPGIETYVTVGTRIPDAQSFAIWVDAYVSGYTKKCTVFKEDGSSTKTKSSGDNEFCKKFKETQIGSKTVEEGLEILLYNDMFVKTTTIQTSDGLDFTINGVLNWGYTSEPVYKSPTDINPSTYRPRDSFTILGFQGLSGFRVWIDTLTKCELTIDKLVFWYDEGGLGSITFNF